MKIKYFKKVYLFFFFLFSFFLFKNEVKSLESFEILQPTEYYDWSEIDAINQDYSFSTLYLTEKTEFFVLKNEGNLSFKETSSGRKLPIFKNIGENQEVILLITHCAVNKNREVLDVVIKVNHVSPFKKGGFINFELRNAIEVPVSQNNPITRNTISLDVGNPMSFTLSAYSSSCNFNLTYYKTGTYHYETDSGVLGDISLVNGFFSDIDVLNTSSQYQNQIFKGNEGIRPDVGRSTIYYNKKKRQPTNPNYQNIFLQEIDNGVAIKSWNENPEGLWFGTSALILTKDIENSTYQFTYGGVDCGIVWFFASPYPYGITEPTKRASLQEISLGQQFTYEISQYIPNDYYANLFNFGEIYPNLKGDSKLKELIIKDTISSLLNVEEEIRIKTETGKEVSDLFDISIEENEVVVRAKASNFSDSTFYNHTYTIYIPVSLSQEVKDISNIKNISTVISKVGEEEKVFQTNEVNLDIKYKLTVHYYKENTTEKIVESDEKYYKYNEVYETDINKVTGMWKVINKPSNAKGIITENTEVVYYFNGFTNPDTGGSIISFIFVLILGILLFLLLLKKQKKIYKV